jgi:anti-sigma regulatory factor (Ser/Thr protein kinase)
MTTLALHPREPEKERSAVPLEASLEAASRARRAIEDLPALRRLPDVCFIARLLGDELVSNALRHAGLRAGEPFRLIAECDQETVRIEVADHGPGVDPLSSLRAHLAGDLRHRGLSLLNALADRWGYRRGDGEFAVWFELDLVPGRRGWLGRDPVART